MSSHRSAVLVVSACFLFSVSGARARDLTFEDRVDAQEAIERVYYSHQLETTRAFEEAVPRSVLEKKVRTYLAQSWALERHWKTSITGEMLQRELERMAQGTRMPERLRELYTALNDDPFVIQECLARATLADRLARSFFTTDPVIHAEARTRAEVLRTRLAKGDIDPFADRPDRSVVKHVMQDVEVDASPTSDPERDLSWSPTKAHSQVVPVPRARWEALQARLMAARESNTTLAEEREVFVVEVVLTATPDEVNCARYAVPKRSWDEWWPSWQATMRNDRITATASASYRLPLPPAGTGTQRTPNLLTCIPEDTWDNGILDGLPDPRFGGHSAIWTGSLMIVWGGEHAGAFNTGGRYDPATDSWTRMTTTNAPPPRQSHTAVWTGSVMVVWGGSYFPPGGGFSITVNTGGRYDPATDTWAPTSLVGALSPRSGHTAVWTGSRMVVWGGNTSSNAGARYDPVADSWTPATTAGAPTARSGHAAVWTGSRMVIWGGGSVGSITGGQYDPIADAWTPTSTVGAPSERSDVAAVWTGSRMLIWGGRFFSGYFGDGAAYDPQMDAWSPLSTTGAPSARVTTAVWTGEFMVVWGGGDNTGGVNSGGRYDPVTDGWSATSLLGAPSPRSGHSAVWTGNRMVVWSGTTNSIAVSDGGRYDPTTDTWTPTGSMGAPSARNFESALWTGNFMVVWGGYDYAAPVPNGYLATGGRYDPVTDAWTAMSTTGAPAARLQHTAIWTGTQMAVWGGSGVEGSLATGGLYDPIADSWIPIATVNAPSARTLTTAVWTGDMMVVWGGRVGNGAVNTGGRYDPVSDTWTPTSMTGVPTARSSHTAVRLGDSMVVWGGYDVGGLNTGGRYDPVGDSWTPTSTIAAPSARYGHTAIATADQMVVWGGRDSSLQITGGRYDIASDQWQPTSTVAAPSARSSYTAVWTGSSMVVWGGSAGAPSAFFDTGGRYDPIADLWRPTSTVKAPSARTSHLAVWTGSMMIVWGGQPIAKANGGRYTPEAVGSDDDGDGYDTCQGDCDDADPTVYPEATESCDGLDNDCNGDVDEDASGTDPDGDGVLAACDNCRITFNPSQIDTDADAVGNACDTCVSVPNPGQLDTDSDGRGDACENCTFDYNPSQTDFDGDGEGDVCDLDDGLIYMFFPSRDDLEWQLETGAELFNVYRGSLWVLRDTGVYSQVPGSNPAAVRECGWPSPSLLDSFVPAAGDPVFYLITSVMSGLESGLGIDSGGQERNNDNPCP